MSGAARSLQRFGCAVAVKAAVLGYPAGPGASEAQATIASCHLAGSTPGGGPVVGPGGAGMPC